MNIGDEFNIKTTKDQTGQNSPYFGIERKQNTQYTDNFESFITAQTRENLPSTSRNFLNKRDYRNEEAYTDSKKKIKTYQNNSSSKNSAKAEKQFIEIVDKTSETNLFAVNPELSRINLYISILFKI